MDHGFLYANQLASDGKNNRSTRDAEPCYASAYAALGQGRDAEARALFSMMVVLWPRDERGWLGLGTVLEQDQQWGFAAAIYAAGARQCPTSALCCLGQGRTLRHLGHKELAADALDRAISLADDSVLNRVVELERTQL